MLKIESELSSAQLRLWAKKCGNYRAACRALAIADSIDGIGRAEAARLQGMDRQALRDAVRRYNDEGVGGLFDRPKGHPPRCFGVTQEKAFLAIVKRGPDPVEDGVCVWTRAALAKWVERRWGKSVHPATLSRNLRARGIDWRSSPNAEVGAIKETSAGG